MKKLLAIASLLIIILTYCSCGGVTGNINKYSFSGTPPEILKDALYRVYKKYPELKKVDTSKYGNNDGEHFYYLLTDYDEKIVFECRVIAPVSDTNTELSLTTAAVWGETMKLAPNMSLSESKKFQKKFEENILPKINEVLKEERPFILNVPASETK